ncbi:MAG TPA: Uma2 family endonuclease [Polyangiaceae bacterium]|jgi:hypothetical protein|nr:MAG: hypothetical protein BWY17_00087 [Deltaproteobacteria bacterium ADurb.Bin207]HNZ20539.1 Uma2 family endonuclease [Polyangiaceae bacterium]HOD24855.1 Uma2 family endonuclease [Polyangiaceae bacterium]HOE47265.1 Uma2 family endonuclease [Polyangiaceae bacterium]HOR33480.1 Uma2 family endonuclease [Polyangiaceae bacterium]
MLYQIAKLALSSQCSIGSAQPVFWNAADPSRFVTPDLFIRFESPDSLFESWYAWERGAPEVAVEILSDSDATELAWQNRLRNYHELGVEEVVRFDPVAPADGLRVWNRVHGDLVERDLEDPRIAESSMLGLYWVVIKNATLGRVLRLAKDNSGGRLLPTPVEREARRRREAELRVRELEQKLKNK